MKIRFRIALLILLLGLLLSSIAAVGGVWFFSARAAARQLAMDVIEQTSLRIDDEVARLLGQASENCDVAAELIRAGRLRESDFDALIGNWLAAMAVDKELSSLFIALEGTGESVGVSRIGGGTTIWCAVIDPATGKRRLREYRPGGYPRVPFRDGSTRLGPDTRIRPWYVLAKQRRRPVWTDAYIFMGVSDVSDVYGVTYAVPIYRDGELKAVLTGDFVLEALCRFLGTLKLGQGGYAFLIEQGDDGRRRMIAHPRSDLVLARDRRDADPAPRFVAIDQIADLNVRAFLDRIPPDASLEPGAAAVNLTIDVGDTRILGSYRPFGGDDGPRWLICTVLPEAEVLAPVHRINRRMLWIMIVAAAVAALVGMYVSRQVASPLERMAKGAERVGHLRLEPAGDHRSIVLEVDRLILAGEEMKAGLRSFGKYVPIDLVRTLLDSGREAVLGGERRELTMYFSDIANFTRDAEALSVEDLVDHLGEYLGAMSETIHATGGTVDKFIGDAVMAFWGAPESHPRHALSACTAALACQRRLDELGLAWRAAGKPPFKTRIGIHTGEVVVGNIGNAQRMNYTVIGDAVNLASRLEGLNKVYGTSILVSEQTRLAAGAAILARPLEWVAVKGKSRGVLIYELMAMHADAEPVQIEIAAIHAEAVELYRGREFDRAKRLFGRILELQPDDGPAARSIARCVEWLAHPPADDWDGVSRMTSK